ncbi:hypothetical protein ACFY05_32815 [Microtetraspora fusca]|uniref:Uncharacterized protein n=1 Tax=Microtetraspora fusca TaxID=1997 RepID=A0ABW6VE35_MICFU
MQQFTVYDAINRGLADATAQPRRPWRRRLVWLNRPSVTIAGATWTAKRTDRQEETPRYGYTIRQARAMKQALLPLMATTAADVLDKLASYALRDTNH